MQKTVNVVVLMCVLTTCYRECTGTTPIPCCDINVIDTSALPSVFKIKKIYINKPTMCGGVNVAKFQYKKENSNVTTEICANGFNLISFILNALQHINHKTQTQETLVQTLTEYRALYASNFSVANTNTSQFKITNGSVVASTRVAKRKR